MVRSFRKEELKNALNSIAMGRIYYSEDLMSYLYTKLRNPNAELEMKLLLTKKEIQILNLIAQGFTDNEIGLQLNLSPRTINGHRNSMLAKTGAKNTVNLIIFCIKNNIIEL